MRAQSLPWADPLEMASGIDEPYWVLLYSGVQASYSGRYSLLACGLEERVEGGSFDAMNGRLSATQNLFDNAWFGYLGYGLKDSLETLTPDAATWLALPDLCLMRFNRIYRFDHVEKTVTLWSRAHGAQR
mgnify:CR=1 FL=1